MIWVNDFIRREVLKKPGQNAHKRAHHIFEFLIQNFLKIYICENVVCICRLVKTNDPLRNHTIPLGLTFYYKLSVHSFDDIKALN